MTKFQMTVASYGGSTMSDIPVHQRYKFSTGNATGGRSSRLEIERHLADEHRRVLFADEQFPDAHLFLISGAPLDAPQWLPMGSLRKVFKEGTAYFSDVPRDHDIVPIFNGLL